MELREYGPGPAFPGVIGRTTDESSPAWPRPLRAEPGSPNEYMERMSYLVTGWRLGRYYRTYPVYVEDEVRAALDDPGTQFQRGPITLRRPETLTSDTPAFVVQDRNYLSARWPGDAYLFARRFCDLLASQEHEPDG